METKRLMKSCAKLGAEDQEKASGVKAPPVLKLPVTLTALTIVEFNNHGSVILPNSSPYNARAEPQRELTSLVRAAGSSARLGSRCSSFDDARGTELISQGRKA